MKINMYTIKFTPILTLIILSLFLVSSLLGCKDQKINTNVDLKEGFYIDYSFDSSYRKVTHVFPLNALIGDTNPELGYEIKVYNRNNKLLYFESQFNDEYTICNFNDLNDSLTYWNKYLFGKIIYDEYFSFKYRTNGEGSLKDKLVNNNSEDFRLFCKQFVKLHLAIELTELEIDCLVIYIENESSCVVN